MDEFLLTEAPTMLVNDGSLKNSTSFFGKFAEKVK
jgi:hypothetical protein